MLRRMAAAVADRLLSTVAGLAFMVVTSNVSVCCWFFFGQAKMAEFLQVKVTGKNSI